MKDIKVDVKNLGRQLTRNLGSRAIDHPCGHEGKSGLGRSADNVNVVLLPGSIHADSL